MFIKHLLDSQHQWKEETVTHRSIPRLPHPCWNEHTGSLAWVPALWGIFGWSCPYSMWPFPLGEQDERVPQEPGLWFLDPQANHKIIRSIQLERALKVHPVQFPYNEQRDLQLEQVLRAPSSLTLTVSRDMAFTTSLGDLCQCLTNLIVKNFISNLNLPCFSLNPFCLFLSQRILLKSLSPSFV